MNNRDVALRLVSQKVGASFYLARIISISGFGGRITGEIMGHDGTKLFGDLMFGSFDSQVLAMTDELKTGHPRGVSHEVLLGDQEAVSAGLACGGKATIAVQSIDELLWLALESIAAKIPVGLATVFFDGFAETLVVASLNKGARSVQGSSHDENVLSKVAQRLEELVNARRSVAEIASIEGFNIHFEVLAPISEALIVGESELARAIAAQLHLLGIESTIFGDLDRCLARLEDFGPNDAVILLSHDMEIGVPICERALQIPQIYIGALGSRHTQLVRRNLLAERGISTPKVDSMFGPVGFDIGAKTPAETALSITAEFIAFRNGRDGLSLRAKQGSIN